MPRLNSWPVARPPAEIAAQMRRDRRADGLVTWGAVVVSTALWIAGFAMLCWALTP